MGKLIMCTGKIAKIPYHFKASGIPVYSMDELCYYIYNQVDIVTEELFDMELITYIREELGLQKRADFLENLLKKNASLKDFIVSIFCSTDYYTEVEIKDLLLRIEELFTLNYAQRKKRHADYCYKNEQYQEALREYRFLLHSKESVELSDVEYGDILHNMAVLKARMGFFSMAAEGFRDAYERNGREESLKQYLYALKLGNQESLYEREKKFMEDNQRLYEELENELIHITNTEEFTTSYQTIQKLIELKNSGRIKEYYQMADEILDSLKQKYRTESM